MAMLPYASVGGLGSLDVDVLAAIFGQTMRIRNALPDMVPIEINESHEAKMRQILSADLQREYWRLKQRESRARRKARAEKPST